MAKRFTDTEKWRDPWFCALTNEQRLFWVYLCDTCTHAGIWQVNLPLVKFYFGQGFELPISEFGDRVVVLSQEKWLVRKFVNFQYGALNPENRAHQSVIDNLQKEGAYKVLASPLQGRKDKDKDICSVVKKAVVSVGTENEFELFWESYPLKVGKKPSLKAWHKLKLSPAAAAALMAALEKQKNSEKWLGGYVPNPLTWLNQERWNDEVAENHEQKINANLVAKD